MINTPEYRAWHNMKSRCNNPRDGAYKHYGGRGITVCQEWNDSFEAFIKYMGKKPSYELSLDRVANDAGYFPGNCRWATWTQQANNTRRTLCSQQS